MLIAIHRRMPYGEVGKLMTMAGKSVGNGSGARRRFLQLLASATVLVTAGSIFGSSAEATVPATEPAGEAVLFSPTELLMIDHGLLKRMILIYGECVRRMDAGAELESDALAETAKIMRSFIEDYHEKIEEEHIFPAFLKAGKLVELVGVLSRQHAAGRELTDMTLSLANAEALRSQPERKKLAAALNLFIRMYGPHEAREDTVLYPAYRSIISPKEFNAMGAYLEFKQQEHMDNAGLEGLTDRIADIEKNLDIYDLSQFTARA